jgi:hypothetical protein
MKEGYTHITVVLDSSGSMDSCKNDTIGGFNVFLRGQKETAKIWDTFSFVKFSSGVIPYSFAYKNAKIIDVPELTSKSWRPTGGTALLDTLLDTIKDLGQFFDSLKEEDKPSKVIFAIITDGEENSSTRATKAQIKALISEHTSVWKWEFIFLGANQDAIQEASHYGISQLNSMSYGMNAKGITSTYETLTRSVNDFKSSAIGVNFAASGGISVADRSNAMGGVPLDKTTLDITSGLFSNTLPTPLSTSKTENVKDDGHSVTVESVSIAAGG